MVRFEEKEESARQIELRRIRVDLAYRTTAVSFGKTEYPCYVMAVSTLATLDYLPDHEEALRLGLLQVLKKGTHAPNSASSYFIAHNWEGFDGETADNKESTKLFFLQNFHANLAISASREIWLWFDLFSIPSHPGRRQTPGRRMTAASNGGSSGYSGGVNDMQSAFDAAHAQQSLSATNSSRDRRATDGSYLASSPSSGVSSPVASPGPGQRRPPAGTGAAFVEANEATEKQRGRRLAAVRSIPAYSQLCSRLLPMIRKKEVWSVLYPQVRG